MYGVQNYHFILFNMQQVCHLFQKLKPLYGFRKSAVANQLSSFMSHLSSKPLLAREIFLPYKDGHLLI